MEDVEEGVFEEEVDNVENVEVDIVENDDQMSDYFKTLLGDVRMRYRDKISVINNIDPYTLDAGSPFVYKSGLPEVNYMDVVAYFLSTHSFFTADKLLSYKSLDSYKFCEAGYVREVCIFKIDEYFVVRAKVKHSQKAASEDRDKSKTFPWLIIQNDGVIKSAHCTCMAGLGEVCSHAAAVSFYLARLNRGTEELSCTGRPCAWNVPTGFKEAGPKEMKDVDLGRKIKNKNYLGALKIEVPALEGDRLLRYLEKLNIADPEAAVLRVIKPFSTSRAITAPDNLPKILTDHFHPDNCQLSIDMLRAKDLEMSITAEQQQAIGKYTVKQSSSPQWYDFRAGRITASKIKAVCSTRIDKPSVSLIKTICYPSKIVFHSKEVNYGINHEKDALNCYKNYMNTKHDNFAVSEVGFIISEDVPEVGASPDALISCNCCGAGCTEIKCPWRCRDESSGVDKLSTMKDTFIEKRENGKFYLRKKHAYYFQVQLQMFVTKRTFCDFVIWSKYFLHVERIPYDEIFVKEIVKKAQTFHKSVIKPELFARFYTEPYTLEINNLCFCQIAKDEEMITCSNPECEIKLFHVNCVNLLDFVDEDWFCECCSENVTTL